MKLYKYRSMVLPVAIVLGFLLHPWCAQAQPIVPFLIFCILLMNYSAVDIKRLRPSGMDLWFVLYQMVASIVPYYVLHAIGVSEIIAQGVLILVISPVAASVVVIACILGANRERVTTYTIVGNLMVAVVAPFYFTLVNSGDGVGFWMAFWLIFRKTFVIIALPFFLAVLGQAFMPKVNAALSRIKSTSFYIWSVTLTIILGQTIHFLLRDGKAHIDSILVLGVVSMLACAIHFALGKWVGRRYHDEMAGGQLLGQKNVAMGVWMANMFLNPLSSVGIALYSIWQNLFNSWQMWRHDR